ncbi:MAG: hypothetical protein ACI4JA_09725 [Oscillospiraceae bacterium]
MDKVEFDACFAELKKSKCSEESDYEVYGYRCEKLGRYMTFWDEPSDEKLEDICRRTCPLMKQENENI